MKIMILNGSLGGSVGNTAKLISILSHSLKASEPNIEIDIRHLSQGTLPLASELTTADAFIFTTGVYWDSWGSPLQRFFENATPLEGDACFFGKPAAVVTSMHSVGGKEVLSRLQGVLNTFGLFIPPMSAMTYSFVNQTALQNADGAGSLASDLWCLEDLQVVADNLIVATRHSKLAKANYVKWPVDRDDPRRLWLTSVSS